MRVVSMFISITMSSGARKEGEMSREDGPYGK